MKINAFEQSSISIHRMCDNEGNQWYEWVMYDGPDGIDDYCGREKSLGECFEKIVRYSYVVELSYK